MSLNDYRYNNIDPRDTKRAVAQLWQKRNEHDNRIKALERKMFSTEDIDLSRITDFMDSFGSLTTGQIMFPDSAGRVSGSSSLFWDDGNSRLGLGTAVPTGAFHIALGATSPKLVLEAADTEVFTSYTGGLNLTYRTDPGDIYGFHLDNTDTESYLWLIDEATYRQCMILSDAEGDETAWGVSTKNGENPWTARLVVTQDGDVGIGKNQPAYRIDAYENEVGTGPMLMLEQANAAGSSAMSFLLTGGQQYVFGIDNSETSDPLKLVVGNDFSGILSALISDNGAGNTFWGYRAGNGGTPNQSNSAFGRSALEAPGTGTSGQLNAAFGNNSLNLCTSGSYNTGFGALSLDSITAADGSTALGYYAGHGTTVGGCVYIGAYSGSAPNATANTLYIDNSNTATPLIYGDFASDYLNFFGSVKIGGAAAAAPSTLLHIYDNSARIDESLLVYQAGAGVATIGFEAVGTGTWQVGNDPDGGGGTFRIGTDADFTAGNAQFNMNQSGQVGINCDDSAGAQLNVLSAGGEHLRLLFSSDYYSTFAVEADGDLVISPLGDDGEGGIGPKNLGIGMSPSYELDVAGAIRTSTFGTLITNYIQARDDGSDIIISQYDDDSAITVYDANANVQVHTQLGVGRAPTVNLDVYENAATTTPIVLLEQANAGGDTTLQFYNSNSGDRFSAGIDITDSLYKINAGTSVGASDQMTMNSSGETGWGTTPVTGQQMTISRTTALTSANQTAVYYELDWTPDGSSSTRTGYGLLAGVRLRGSNNIQDLYGFSFSGVLYGSGTIRDLYGARVYLLADGSTTNITRNLYGLRINNSLVDGAKVDVAGYGAAIYIDDYTNTFDIAGTAYGLVQVGSLTNLFQGAIWVDSDSNGLVLGDGQDYTLSCDGTYFQLNYTGQTNQFTMNSNGNIGIRNTPDNRYILKTGQSALDTDADFVGIYNYHVKTAGASNQNDDMFAVWNRMDINQAGGVVGQVRGAVYGATLTAGTIGTAAANKLLIGLAGSADSLGGTTIEGSQYGLYFTASSQATTTITGDICGAMIRCNNAASVGGTAYGAYIYANGCDYAIYSEQAVPSQFHGNLEIDSDTYGLVLGDGQDSIIYDNGSNLIINSDNQSAGSRDINIINADVKIGGSAGDNPAGRLEVYDGNIIHSRLANGAVNIITTYSTTDTDISKVDLRKSHSDTEASVATLDGDRLGGVYFAGFDTAPGVRYGAIVWAVQNDDATADYVPTRFDIHTDSLTGREERFSINNDTGINLLLPTKIGGSLEDTPAASLEVSGGDIYISTNTNGLILGDPVGSGPSSILYDNDNDANLVLDLDRGEYGGRYLNIIKGKVIIGIDADSTSVAELEVGIGTADENLRLSYDATNYTSFTVESDGNLVIDPKYSCGDSNVGIGMSPSYKLDVDGDIRSSGHVFADNLRPYTGSGSLTLNNSGLNKSVDFTNDGFFRANDSRYRRYYHLPISAFAPGASGATWVTASTDHVAGWLLDTATEVLEFNTDVHADWDGASDLTVEVKFLINTAGSSEGDDVRLTLTHYNQKVGESSAVADDINETVVIDDAAQYTMFNAEFVIDYDKVAATEVGDQISFQLICTNVGDVDDIIVVAASYFYNKTHIGLESGDT